MELEVASTAEQHSLALNTGKATWDSRVPLSNPTEIISALRSAGLPLANTNEPSEDESSQSQLVCIAEVQENAIRAVIATPSGLVYRFEPMAFEQSFWAFAARHYYWVTGSMKDREKVSALTEVALKSIKGRTLSRTKSEQSNMALDEILAELGYFPEKTQTDLF